MDEPQRQQNKGSRKPKFPFSRKNKKNAIKRGIASRLQINIWWEDGRTLLAWKGDISSARSLDGTF
jgi:hypothetical protein